VTTPTPDPAPQPTAEEDYPRFAFVYNPPGAEPQEWEFDPTEWTVGEMVIAERIYRRPRDEILAAVNEGYDDAKCLLLWLLRKRTEPELELADIHAMKTGALHLYQLVPDAPSDDDTQEATPDDDPEPDAVNDPKAGKRGTSESASAPPTESKPTSQTSPETSDAA
jgi:hypothetical protein